MAPSGEKQISTTDIAKITNEDPILVQVIDFIKAQLNLPEGFEVIKVTTIKYGLADEYEVILQKNGQNENGDNIATVVNAVVTHDKQTHENLIIASRTL